MIADNSNQVLSNWENIKIQEKGYSDDKEYIESTAKSLPALMRAEKIRKRLIKRKLIEKPEIQKNDIDSEKIGEMLYEIVTLAVAHDINPEQALYDFNKKLINSIKIDKNN